MSNCYNYSSVMPTSFITPPPQNSLFLLELKRLHYHSNDYYDKQQMTQ